MRRSAPGVVVDFAEFTDPGRDPDKQINEDCAGAATTPHGLLFVVCDGVGGHVGGREASHTAVATILSEVERNAAASPPGWLLRGAIIEASRAIHSAGGDEAGSHRPGSTCVAVLMGEHGTVVAHVGDSRVYRLREGTLHRLTRDHSVVQELVDTGRLSPSEAARHPDLNRITRALGVVPDVEVEVAEDPLLPHPNDLFLLCTDGLTDMATDEEILNVLVAAGADPDLAGRALIDLANARGGHDNITVELVRVVGVHDSGRPRIAPTIADNPPASGKTSGLTVPWGLSAPRTQPDFGTLPGPPYLPELPPPPRAPSPRPVPWALWLFLLMLIVTLLLGTLGILWWRGQQGRSNAERQLERLGLSVAEGPKRPSAFPERDRFDMSF